MADSSILPASSVRSVYIQTRSLLTVHSADKAHGAGLCPVLPYPRAYYITLLPLALFVTDIIDVKIRLHSFINIGVRRGSVNQRPYKH